MHVRGEGEAQPLLTRDCSCARSLPEQWLQTSPLDCSQGMSPMDMPAEPEKSKGLFECWSVVVFSPGPTSQIQICISGQLRM